MSGNSQVASGGYTLPTSGQGANNANLNAIFQNLAANPAYQRFMGSGIGTPGMPTPPSPMGQPAGMGQGLPPQLPAQASPTAFQATQGMMRGPGGLPPMLPAQASPTAVQATSGAMGGGQQPSLPVQPPQAMQGALTPEELARRRGGLLGFGGGNVR